MRLLVLVLAASLAACVSETMERNPTGMWAPQGGFPKQTAPDKPEPPPKPEPKKGTEITIPKEVSDQQADFSARESTIFGDVVEIDATREPWLGLMSISLARDAVKRSDNEDSQAGVLTISLQRLPGSPVTLDAIPTVRFAGGLRVVGIERVVLRFWAKRTVERPIWFQATAAGKKAAYQVVGPPEQKWAGARVGVRAEIRQVGSTYRFETSAEAKP